MFSDLDRPPLDARFLRGRLVRPGSLWTQIDVLAETPSTNAVVAAAAADGAAEGLVVAAELQSSGRGRLGRTWTTPARSALLMSALLRPTAVAAARWPWLGLLVPLAVAAAVRQVGEIPALVKWPNDVLVEDRKLAGILLLMGYFLFLQRDLERSLNLAGSVPVVAKEPSADSALQES